MGNNPYAQWGGALVSTPATTATPQQTPNPYAEFGGGLVKPQRVKPNTPAAQPGAYQQAPGAPIRNANTEAANPFVESHTSTIPRILGTERTGAMMKRPEESDTQFMARVKEAGKHVTPAQIEQEEKGNIARALPTAGAALVAGPLTLGAEAGAATLARRPALQLVEHELTDALGNPIKQTVERNAVGYAKTASDYLGKIAADNPKVAKLVTGAAKVYGGYLVAHMAHKLGIPMPKILELLAE